MSKLVFFGVLALGIVVAVAYGFRLVRPEITPPKFIPNNKGRAPVVYAPENVEPSRYVDSDGADYPVVEVLARGIAVKARFHSPRNGDFIVSFVRESSTLHYAYENGSSDGDVSLAWDPANNRWHGKQGSLEYWIYARPISAEGTPVQANSKASANPPV